ncbi:hypothetical protein GCM10010399_46570 [Dactylosporangium fulvum]|uniref:Uncharacterized protein n=1 Tax=Dactylosporangium fulvum TaxID=53359 RepID=A0ABY5W0N3_9ACTN|nr:hypothetical protein [Dactylosporangium fulvum]UWP83553.1 hypothetical protein Dfulv_04520 [Dactylosporangium fulvum]
MGARTGDYLVLLGPPVAVGAAVGVVVMADSPEAFLPLLIVLQPLTTLGIVLGLVQLTRSNRGPSTFRLVGHDGRMAFAVRPNFRRQCLFNGLLSAALVLMAVTGLRVPGRVVPAMAWAILVLNATALVLMLHRMLRSGPLLLTADGIAIDGGRTFVPWAALEAGPDSPQWTLARPELVRGRRIKAFQPGQVVPLEVSLWFLSLSIHSYLAHPEHRAAIGTPEELDRLRGALTRQFT